MTLRYHKHWQKTGDLLCGLNKLMRYLDDKTTLKLLRTATKVKSPEAVVHFYKPDLMEQLTSKQVEEVLQAAASGTSEAENLPYAMLRIFSALPVAQQLSRSSINNCITAIITKGDNSGAMEGMQALLDLPAVTALQAADLEELLSTAITHRNYEAAGMLLVLPAAAQLSADGICKLLQRTISLSAQMSQPLQLVNQLLELPAVADISPAAAANTIKLALELHPDQAMEFLRKLCSRLVNLDAAGLLQLTTTATQLDHSHLENQEKPDESIWCLLKVTNAAMHFSVPQLLLLLPLLGRRLGTEQHKLLMQYICLLPAVQQLTAGDVQQLLLLAIQEGWQHMAQALLALPAAQLLFATEIETLLLKAATSSAGPIAADLCSLPSARSVQPEVLTEAVLSGLTCKLDDDVLSKVCGLLASSISVNISTSQHHAWESAEAMTATAQSDHISKASPQQPESQGTAVLQHSTGYSSMLDKVLHVAIKSRCMPVINQLIENPAVAALLSSDAVQQLMQIAAEQRFFDGLRCLCDLPAAADVAAPLGTHLVSAAIQQSSTLTVDRLCRLPMTKELQPETLVRLLQQAQLHCSDDAVYSILVYAPAARCLDADTVFDLIVGNLQFSSGFNVFQYMRTPAVQQFTVQQVSDLLVTGIEYSHWYLVVSLCSRVRAAYDIHPTAAEALVQTCLLRGSKELVLDRTGTADLAHQALFRLPGFRMLSAEAVRVLLGAAIVHKRLVMVKQLVQLPAAAQLTVSDMEELLCDVLSAVSEEVTPECLWTVPACKSIAPEALAELVELALMRAPPSRQTQAVAVMRRNLLWMLKHTAIRHADHAILRALLLVVNSKDFADVPRALMSMLGEHVLCH